MTRRREAPADPPANRSADPRDHLLEERGRLCSAQENHDWVAFIRRRLLDPSALPPGQGRLLDDEGDTRR
jgi:hypothetical protein